MNTAINHLETTNQKSLTTKILAAWILGLLSLALANWLGAISMKYWGFSSQGLYILQALVFVGLAVPGVWLLRVYLDKGVPISIGIGNFKQSILKFGIGMGLLVVPVVITLICTTIFGWGKISYNLNSSILSSILIGIIITFLYEALPEELIFRGYIYSNLNTKYKRWVSSLITIGLFALLPVILVSIQKYILGLEVQVGKSTSIETSYIIIMIIFGAFVQYLRILSKSIWIGIGFHLMFVFINRIMGLEDTNLIQFTEFTTETPMQITFATCLIIVFILLLIYPKLIKRKIGWNEITG